ncbi:MarR family winged helix-turn-helix transcriptional regulator [Streptomyces sp. HUAS 31]|uniref:Winged helix-turn-helix transcriptional regulator n=1 Tax=Streptomyces chartreusis TaxID=1969 RepID=A0A7H8T503_STRCX|nr:MULTISPECIES: MarR family winged helix-turn-helix transcriptional regulator [Streptomyces]QEV66041.1 MarR family transcriptional regulator [Streptomyces chartreusis]QKZ16970.1 winged helix-turn-helix transcriptional regulator [Streptomyces chartreusis]RSN84799.1 MarR family transcriptional regulator [Streptomyces sp. WAC 05379]WCE01084.1 MarR family winged helix-turn-helix transcriptional regulator [Streptomyces sp. HUAS 31]SEB66100.1 DNA-binding transcriptional regulator, MarR family [Stre
MNDSAKPLSPDDLGHRVSEVFDLIGALYRRGLRKLEQGEEVEGVSVGVRSVLVLLHRYGPMTVPQMGRLMTLTRQFVQRMVNDALARGWAETTPNPAHQRSSLIRITDEGEAVITAILAREHALNRQVGGELTEAELQACVRVLKEMLKTFDHVEAD